MAKLEKVIFPFRSKYTYLRKYWWHRLFVVIFFVLLVAILLSVWMSLNKSEMNPYSACISLNLHLNRPIDEGCNVFVVHPKTNFTIAFLATIISSYLLQFIYYKIFIYIVFGSKAKNEG